MAEKAATKTLYNKGERRIQYGKSDKAILHPKTAVTFPADKAEYLKKLYPNELTDSSDVQTAFDDPNEAVTDAATATETAETGEGNTSEEGADSAEESEDGSESADAPRRGRKPKAA